MMFIGHAMPKKIALHVGQEIRIGRARHDLTIQQLATAAGLNPATITRIERGRNRPTPKTLARLASALNLPELLERAIREGADA